MINLLQPQQNNSVEWIEKKNFFLQNDCKANTRPVVSKLSEISVVENDSCFRKSFYTTIHLKICLMTKHFISEVLNCYC